MDNMSGEENLKNSDSTKVTFVLEEPEQTNDSYENNESDEFVKLPELSLLPSNASLASAQATIDNTPTLQKNTLAIDDTNGGRKSASRRYIRYVINLS